jgi:hypothetical protein
MRTNCLDCLDRTNVIMTKIGNFIKLIPTIFKKNIHLFPLPGLKAFDNQMQTLGVNLSSLY